MRMQNRFVGAGGVMALKRRLGTKELRECRNALFAIPNSLAYSLALARYC